MTYYLVKGDTGSQIEVTFKSNQTGDPIVLTGKTTKLYFRAKNTTSVLFTLAGTHTDEVNGKSLFEFGSNLNTIDVGYYEAELEITNADTTIDSVYELLYFKVRDDFT